MQGFNRYFPPDFDPKKHDTLNNYHGKHALGDRARKIDQGILITRFELPFNIWCESCKAHIGMGVRYNAEKKKVGMYYSTPIYSFRCKCHLCGNWFEIRTDPQNTRYVVESGAKQKNEEWDPAENGGISLESKPQAGASDPFALVEKQSTDKEIALATKDRLEDLYELSESRNSDPYVLSQKLRRSFRKEKAELIVKSRNDDSLRDRYSLPTNLKLDEPDPSLLLEETQSSKVLIDEGKSKVAAKRLRLEAELGLPSLKKRTRIDSSPLSILKDRLTLNTRRTLDPFLSSSSSSSSPSLTSSRLRSSLASSRLLIRPSLSNSSSSSILNTSIPSKTKLEQKCDSSIKMLTDYDSD
ncbi:CWC16 protein [Melampsora americana]|nr:CWC16 protein [Melampsora americana]